MITIISGTNRPNSRTRIVSEYILHFLKEEKGMDAHIVLLDELTADIYHHNMYADSHQHPDLSKIQDELIIPAEHLIWVSPEYNGSFSAAIKVFIDALSIRKYKDTFYGKSAALIGVATGRGGNLRGLDHLMGLMSYLGIHVWPKLLPLSSISNQIKDGELNDTIKQAIQETVLPFVTRA